MNGEFLKANVLLFLSLCELLSSSEQSSFVVFQPCKVTNLGAMLILPRSIQMTRDQAQNACNGGSHIKCETNKKQSRNLNSVPSARVIIDLKRVSTRYLIKLQYCMDALCQFVCVCVCVRVHLFVCVCVFVLQVYLCVLLLLYLYIYSAFWAPSIHNYYNFPALDQAT